MTTLKLECRKFAPNIFNKTKCQNCFRTKEGHSAEALECNRASRKVSKCGYLFVAPDWDFTVSINRTKRWQRRWFVLYDDGELTYSVDEHPDTVPQAVIDMNIVLEVSDAEDITGNQFAIAITAPEKVHFVKGTSREESRWWFDALSGLPRNNSTRGKHKRNATFPGGTASTTSLSIISDHKPSARDQDPAVELVSRPRFLSSSETSHRKDWSWLQIDPNDEDVFPTKDCDDVIVDDAVVEVDDNENVDPNNALNKLIATTVACFSNGSSLLQTKPQSECVGRDSDPKDTEGDSVDGNAKKARSRRYLKRENRGMRSQRSRSDGVAKMIPGREHIQDDINVGHKTHHDNPVYLLLSEAQNRTTLSSERLMRHNGSMMSPIPLRRRHTSDFETIAPVPSPAASEPKTQSPLRTLKKSESLMNIASELSPEMRNRISELKRNHSYKGSPSMYRDKMGGSQHLQNKTSSTFISAIRPVRDTDPKPQMHGDAEKNGGPCSSSSWDAGVDICTQDMLMKKGWLLRQTLSKEWSRHWFVLKNASLTYYRDPSAEDCGILDGVLDLNQVTSIEEMEMDKNFAFSLIMWDCKKHVLSAISATMRTSWIRAIQRASNLWDSESRRHFSKEEIVLPDRSLHLSDSRHSDKSHFGIPSSPLLSPEQEKGHDLSSSDDQSEYFSIIDEEEVNDRTSSPRTLPPSPPVNRTAMSLVKERARSRSNSYSLPSRQSLSVEGSPLKHADTNSDDSSSIAVQSRNTSQVIETQQHSQVKQPGTGLQEHSQLAALQNHCKDLEKKLEVKTKEMDSKVMDLDAFRKLKSAYQILVDQRRTLKKSEDEKTSSIESMLDSNSYRLKYELLKAKYIQDRMDWENKYKKEKSSCLKDSNFDSYVKILQKTKQAVNELKEKLLSPSGEPSVTVNTSKEIQQLLYEMERISPSGEKKLKRDHEVKKLRKMAAELQLVCKHKQQKFEEEQLKCSSLNAELEKSNGRIQELQQELQSLRNDYVHVLQPLKPPDEFAGENYPPIAKSSQSCTFCEALNCKLSIAKEQIQKLKKDIKDSHASCDNLEIYCFQLKQDMKAKEDSHQSQLALMTARVDDLTSKFTLSEKNLRQAKHKMSKLESRQERRRSSLKNKESLSLSKECEAKLFELECKIAGIEDELKEDKLPMRKDLPVSSENHSESSDLCIDPDKHLQKRLSLDSTTSNSENTGILLRLHTLGMRVKSAGDTVEKQALETTEENDLVDKPKICLQVRNEEESNVQEEGGEDWSTLSYATSLTDLQALDGLDGDLPCTFNECFQGIEQKLECLLSWAKTAIQFVQKQDVSLVDYFQNCNVMNKDIISLSTDVIEVLDGLPDLKFEDSPTNAAGFEMTKLCYKTLLLLETSRVLQKIMNCESSVALVKLSVCNVAFKFIQNHFDKLKDSENRNLSSINDCCSLLDRLISISSSPYESFRNDSLEDFSQVSQQPLNRLLIIQEFCSQLLQLLDEAKDSQFSVIYHILEDVPVQDAEVCSKQRNTSFADDLLELDPLLSNIATMLNGFFQVAEDQLCNPLQENFSLLLIENNAWESWTSNTCKLLKLELYSSMDELKKLFPQAREGSLFPFGFSDALYKKVVLASAELARIALLRVITQSVLSFVMEQTSFSSDCDYGEWVSHLYNNICSKALSIAQGDVFHNACSNTFENLFFNHILDAGAREIKIAEQMEAIHHLHQRNVESLQSEVETLRHENGLLSEHCKLYEADKIKLLELQEKLDHVSKDQRHCEQCHALELQLHTMKDLHESDLRSLIQHKEQTDELHNHLQLVIEQKEEMHMQEVQKLEDELQSAHKRLNHLEIEYNEQIQSLRELYEQKMSLKQDPINEESVRRRYQTEIEQLKGLCEKGLIAMENSYRRITVELERRHKQELSILEAEKERALQDETQATFTALEVMRKAHAEELQREINRFKQEFIDKMHTEHETKVTYQRHESELEEIKREILSLSDKYSVKCLETASLEERVEMLQHELQETNHQLFDITARNKQLKVHLALNISQEKDAIEGRENSLESLDDMKSLLRLRENEIAEQREENAELKQELHLAQMHVSMLDVQCEQLNQSLKAERRLREDEVSSLRTRLESIIASSSSVASEESLLPCGDIISRGAKLSPTRGFLFRSPSLNLHSHMLGSSNASRRMLAFARAKELLRSPSCPGLENSAPS